MSSTTEQPQALESDPIRDLVDSVNRTFNRGESFSQFSDRLLRELSGDAQ